MVLLLGPEGYLGPSSGPILGPFGASPGSWKSILGSQAYSWASSDLLARCQYGHKTRVFKGKSISHSLRILAMHEAKTSKAQPQLEQLLVLILDTSKSVEQFICLIMLNSMQVYNGLVVYILDNFPRCRLPQVCQVSLQLHQSFNFQLSECNLLSLSYL